MKSGKDVADKTVEFIPLSATENVSTTQFVKTTKDSRFDVGSMKCDVPIGIVIGVEQHATIKVVTHEVDERTDRFADGRGAHQTK